MRLYVVSSLVLAALLLAGCGNNTPPASKPPAKAPLTALVTKDIKVGTGPKAQKGDVVYLHYRGKLPDGREFSKNDSSDPRPFVVHIGGGDAIEGMDQGLIGMQEGGKREIKIPSKMAYGPQGNGPIPSNSDLEFTLEVLYVLTPERAQGVTFADTKEGTGPAVKEGDAVTINYTASFIDGHNFDSGNNYMFIAGSGKVLPDKTATALLGLSRGVIGMKKGGKRTLVLPPAMLFGPRGGGALEADDLLKFEVELVKVGK